MLLRTDCSLSSVGVSGEELVQERVNHLFAVVAQVEIILLINGLKLGVEAADYHILETVGLYASPVLNLVAGDVLYIDRLVKARVSVCAVRTYQSHQLVVLVGDVVLGGELTDTVNLMVSLFACGGVCQLTISLLNLVE